MVYSGNTYSVSKILDEGRHTTTTTGGWGELKVVVVVLGKENTFSSELRPSQYIVYRQPFQLGLIYQFWTEIPGKFNKMASRPGKPATTADQADREEKLFVELQKRKKVYTGFPKKTPVSQISKIFLIYLVMIIRKVK